MNPGTGSGRYRLLSTLLLFTLWAVSSNVHAQEEPTTEEPSEMEEIASPPLEVLADFNDIYCSGFISERSIPASPRVIGGQDDDLRSSVLQFLPGKMVYLQGRRGETFSPGDEFQVVRKDLPHRYSWYPGQSRKANGLGHQYADVARIKVVSVRPEAAVAEITSACDGVVRGDRIIPFQTRPRPMVRLKPKTEAYSPASGKLGGKIVVFEGEHGWALEGSIVFLNVGRSEGVRPGNYFTIYVTDRKPLYFALWGPSYPRENIGELLVLDTYERSSKALITYSARQIYPGDQIELQ